MSNQTETKLSKDELEALLIVGAKVRIGKEYAKEYGFNEGEVIELIEGSFECDNGLYCYNVSSPAIYNEDQKDYDSIYHLFGNDFEHFLDCEIVTH